MKFQFLKNMKIKKLIVETLMKIIIIMIQMEVLIK